MRLTRCDVLDISLQVGIGAIVVEIVLIGLVAINVFQISAVSLQVAVLGTTACMISAVFIAEFLYRRAKRRGLGRQWLIRYIGEPFEKDSGWTSRQN